MLTLCYAPATASMCVHHVRIELGAEHELVLMDLGSGHQLLRQPRRNTRRNSRAGNMK